MRSTSSRNEEDVTYCSDNEPTAIQVLKLLVTSRNAGGLKTMMRMQNIKYVFLQVNQEVPTQVSAGSGHFAVLKNLPAQRIGAKAWFDEQIHFMAGGRRG